MVDAGNALFRAPGLADDANTRRAQFILSAMGRLGVQAMAVGQRDLDLGVEWLKAQAAAAHVPLVSVNAVGKDGKPAFPPSMIVPVGGVRVGIIGASPGAPDPKTGVPASAAPAVVAEAKKLKGKVDLVLVLAAIPYADALQLSTDAKDDVDFIIQTHDGARGALQPQANAGNFVLTGGERGREVGKLEINLSGKGPFVDLAESAREAELAKMMDGQIASLKQRQASAQNPKDKADLAKTIEQFEKNKALHEKNAVGPGKGARTVKLDWVMLSPERASDPALQAEVEKIEPVTPEH